jgi:hypothetical protein
VPDALISDTLIESEYPPAAIDLPLDGEGFDCIDRNGQNTGKHGGIVGELGRTGNAVFSPMPTQG